MAGCSGKERDSESGNDYFGKRYYWNASGRWLSVDPVLGGRYDPQRLNRYSHSLNDPVNYVDPDGGEAEAVVDINCVNVTQRVEAPRGDPITMVTQVCSATLSLLFNPSKVVTAKEEKDAAGIKENLPCPGGQYVAALLNFGPEAAFAGYILAGDAVKKTSDLIDIGVLPGGNWSWDGGPADAFRHCYWSCTMAKAIEIGPNTALGIGQLHEACTRNNPPASKAMDLHNNSVGVEIGKAGGDCEMKCYQGTQDGTLTILNPKKPDQQ